ncbi:MAG: hypothetical protein JSU85_06460 [Candidatus Zixiibacteriota bacterium]|nr:MAG: hypothetical protein JSU85_06460 [candidate division Zixibacteria bacterium]
MRYLIIISVLVVAYGVAEGGEYPLGFSPISNEVSLYQNCSDDGDNLGQTLQLVLINSIDIGTELGVEFTADFNRKMTPGKDRDYYLEFGLVKSVWKNFSVNYQRIHGTFIGDPVNQFGIRYRF